METLKNICFIHRGGNAVSDALGSAVASTEVRFEYRGKNSVQMLLSAYRMSCALPKADIYLAEGGHCFWVAFFRKLRHPRVKIAVMAIDPLFDWRRRGFVTNALLRRVFRLIDAVLPVSGQVAADAEWYIPHTPQFPVTHFVDGARYRSIVTDPSQKNILYMIHRPRETGYTKGLDIALDVFSRLGPEWHLYIIGEGTEQLPDAGPNVHREGTQDPAAYFARCPLLIVPARYEASSRAAMEAACAGVLPVVSLATGARELLDPALVADCADPEGFARAVLRAAALPAHERAVLVETIRSNASAYTRERSFAELAEAVRHISI